jgi:hypothetical protein
MTAFPVCLSRARTQVSFWRRSAVHDLGADHGKAEAPGPGLRPQLLKAAGPAVAAADKLRDAASGRDN